MRYYLTFLLFLSTYVSANTLEVTINNIDNSLKGDLIIEIYISEDDWLNQDKVTIKKQIPIKDFKNPILFENISTNIIGVSVLHDENNNEKLDMRWLPFPRPKEGSGVSNNNFGLAIPKWKKAKIDITKEKAIQIDLKYF